MAAKINYLDKVAEQNRKKGKEVDGLSRLNYDLAIIVARYPAYLTWLKKQQIAAEQPVETTRQQYIDYSGLSQGNALSSDSVDLSSIINEI